MDISSIGSTTVYNQVQAPSSANVSQAPAASTPNIGPAATVEISAAAVQKCCG